MKTSSFVGWCFVLFLSVLGEQESYAQRLIVIRHGESISNVEGKVNSSPDESEKYPLTEKGRQQVKNAAKRLGAQLGTQAPIRWVYVSPLLRARETAQILMQELGIDPRKKLIDYHVMESAMGSFEGRSIDTELMQNPDWAKAFSGESLADVTVRMRSFLERIKVLHSDDTVLVVTHGTPMVELVHLLGNPADERIRPMNAEYRILTQE